MPTLEVLSETPKSDARRYTCGTKRKIQTMKYDYNKLGAILDKLQGRSATIKARCQKNRSNSKRTKMPSGSS